MSRLDIITACRCGLLEFLDMKMNEYIGAYLAKFRKEHGLTLDDIATASNAYGSGWTTGTISLMERGGSKADSLQTIIILAATIGDLRKDSFPLSEFFVGKEPIEIGDGLSVEAYEIGDILTGSDVELASVAELNESTEEWVQRFTKLHAEAWRVAEIAVEEWGEYKKPLPDSLILSSRHVPTLSEKRAAKKLNIPVEDFNAWCLEVYGKYLDEITSELAGDNASAQKRGAVTRKVISAIEKKMEDKKEWLTEHVLNDRPGK